MPQTIDQDHDPSAPNTLELGLDMPSAALMTQNLAFYMNGIGFRDLGTIDIDLSHLNMGQIKVHALRFGTSTIKLKHNVSTDKPDALRALRPEPVMLLPPGEGSTKQGAQVRFALFVDPVGTQVELVQGRPWVGTLNDDGVGLGNGEV